ncbi:MAG: hypothetical protein IPP77_13560 [Bacteroidetes bacterium]|nr:hypothetical protein [Bacteroidota bacterium]
MKRYTFALLTALSFLVMGSLSVMAQDDNFYDPKTDKALQNQTPKSQPANQNDDKTDGYGNSGTNSANKYDEKDKGYSDYTQDNDLRASTGYDQYEDYYYTSRLRRYYTPSYGNNYYSYAYTPSYYFGWSNWNTSFYVSSNPWYNDPWWRWNHPRRTAIVIYDPYWDWNWGWNSSPYFNSWSNPWGGYCGAFSWGYNPYAYNGCNWGYSNYGWGGGGYYNNYGGGRGYNQGYYHGYRNGYNNGYWDRYGNNPYYGYGYGGGAQVSNPGGSQQNPGNGVRPSVKTLTNMPVENSIVIPKQGNTRPVVPETHIKKEPLVPINTVRPIETVPVQPNRNIQQTKPLTPDRVIPQQVVPRQNENVIQQTPENRNWDRQNNPPPVRPQENIQRVPQEQIQQPRIIQQPSNMQPPRDEPRMRNMEPQQNIERWILK